MKIKKSKSTLINSLFLFVFLATFQLLNAQAPTRTTTTADTSLSAIEARLVELALNGPTLKEAIHHQSAHAVWRSIVRWPCTAYIFRVRPHECPSLTAPRCYG